VAPIGLDRLWTRFDAPSPCAPIVAGPIRRHATMCLPRAFFPGRTPQISSPCLAARNATGHLHETTSTFAWHFLRAIGSQNLRQRNLHSARSLGHCRGQRLRALQSSLLLASASVKTTPRALLILSLRWTGHESLVLLNESYADCIITNCVGQYRLVNECSPRCTWRRCQI